MWDDFPLAGPGIVFFADFGGAAHPVRDSYSGADFPAGHCTRMAGSADLRVFCRCRCCAWPIGCCTAGSWGFGFHGALRPAWGG